jgi:predicted MPP superfamily phosphohydrolase
MDPFAAHGLHQSLRWTADALILAGDLAETPARNWSAALAFLRRYMPPQRIFVLAGNHDYYGHRLDGDEDLRALAQTAGVQFVQKQELDTDPPGFLHARFGPILPSPTRQTLR